MPDTQRAVLRDSGITSREKNILIFSRRGSREKCVKAATSQSRQHVSSKPPTAQRRMKRKIEI